MTRMSGHVPTLQMIRSVPSLCSQTTLSPDSRLRSATCKALLLDATQQKLELSLSPFVFPLLSSLLASCAAQHCRSLVRVSFENVQ